MNSKRKLIVGVLALLVVMTMGYALFSETVTIGGTAKADGNLSVIFDDIDMSKVEISGGIKINKLELTGGNKKLLIDVSMDYPGSQIYIPITIRNNGDINAYVKGIKLNNIKDYSKFYPNDLNIMFSTDETMDWKQLTEIKGIKLMANKIQKFYLLIEWEGSNINDKTNINYNYSIELDVEQLANNQLPPYDETYPSSGKYAVGNKFCLKNECFNIIKDNGNSVDALASYNLNKDLSVPVKQTNLINEVSAYGIPFSKKIETKKPDYNYGYWTDDTGKLMSKYGNTYPFNLSTRNIPRNSEISEIGLLLDSYSNYLKSIGYNILDYRLMSSDEIKLLGCNDLTCSEIFNNSWLLNGQQWWTNTILDDRGINAIRKNGNISRAPFFIGTLGIRPVITIEKSEIR